ncbi:hypothetical protein [Tuberibacillus sp. Marseille-P3662]|uniref:hypothetical protein n=1 Tax=Tuberibacillus sp. Marseille-P3662 TaxID=1965358 RepID=UPI000A1CAFBD|nr:hypothetical protein [Tuberibacillus sp. Marseille-P3662]
MYDVRLLRGLFKPNLSFYQLTIAESYKGFRWRLILLMLLSIIIFSISAGFGLGTEVLSGSLAQVSPETFAATKLMYIFGKAILGLLFAVIILLVPSLLYWTLTPSTYGKLVIVQLFVLSILLIEKVIMIPLVIWGGIEWFSSPLSLGVIGQFITHNEFVIKCLGIVSLLKLWAVIVQYKGIKRLNREMSWKNILLMVVMINVIFWIIEAVLASVNFTRLI